LLIIFFILLPGVVLTEMVRSLTLRKEPMAYYNYTFVPGDPMDTRIYTLDNGLKVYLSRYTDAPRIQVLVPVKAGGKFDPAENTGLAHYLEHMMFKGNDQFGSIDWPAEKVLLDSIENMFNHYSTLTDADERKAFYALIDDISGKAAELAIPNEMDKMMAMIGAEGLNAYTTEDRTVYMVDIPSNELERYLKIESARFRKIVNRLFIQNWKRFMRKRTGAWTTISGRPMKRFSPAFLPIIPMAPKP
jgi:zinc protease